MRVKFKKWAVDYLKTSLDNQIILDDKTNNLSSFLSNKKSYIEIGPGKGDFIISLASRYPELNFIVVELNKTIAGICLKKIDESNLKNIKLIADDFFKLKDKIKKESIEGIFLNFSDPWPKKRHEKRRLTSDNFIVVYSSILRNEGLIYFKTDNKDLFKYSVDKFNQYKFKKIKLTRFYNKLDKFDALTEYEIKFKNKKYHINRCIYKKTNKTIKEVIKDE